MLKPAIWASVLVIGVAPVGGAEAERMVTVKMQASRMTPSKMSLKTTSSKTPSLKATLPRTEPSKAPPAAAPPPDIKPYDPQLMRLAEMLGALSYLRGLCGGADAATWQLRMQALLEAEGTTQNRKDRLAGAYNRGIAGYEISYRRCTPNAQAIIERFLGEAAAIAKDVENHFGAT